MSEEQGPRVREVVAASVHEKRVRAARERLDVFAEMCARDEHGGSIELAAIHRMWIGHVDYCWARGLHAMILAPFGSGKSTTFAVPLAAWLIGHDPQVRIQVVCSGDPLARRRVSAAKTLMGSPAYREIFPNVLAGTKWGEHELFVRRAGHDPNPSLLARGVGTQGVGSRSDVTIFDDVCDQLNTTDELRREKVKQLVHATWLSRLDERDGRALWIATPWHAGDATHLLMHNSRWCTLIQRVSADFRHYDQEVINAGNDYEVAA